VSSTERTEPGFLSEKNTQKLAAARRKRGDRLKNELVGLSNDYINKQYDIIDDGLLKRPEKKQKLQEHNITFINNWIDKVNIPSRGVSEVRYESKRPLPGEKERVRQQQESLRERETIIKGQIAKNDARRIARRNRQEQQVDASTAPKQRFWKNWKETAAKTAANTVKKMKKKKKSEVYAADPAPAPAPAPGG